MARLSIARAGGISRLAFLDMIALCEFGSAMLEDPAGDDGYKLIVGSLPGKLKIMDDYHDHPQVVVYLPRYEVYSSAAGRYQFLAKTWDGLVDQFHYPDFTPEQQDLGALALIRQRGALAHLDADRLEQAIFACHNIWASLPGAEYGQQVRSLKFCQDAFNAAFKHYQAPVANRPDFSNVISGVESTAPAWEHDHWEPPLQQAA